MDDKYEHVCKLFREARQELFRLTKFRDAHEREWETEEQERIRTEQNEAALAVWNEETERLINDIE